MTVKNEKIIVMDLNETNIDEFAKSMHLKGPIFIAFLADWCGHCQTVKPIWKEALETIKNINGRGHVVTVSDKHMGKLPCQQPAGFPSFNAFKANSESFFDKPVFSSIDVINSCLFIFCFLPILV
jgi:thiol-disulfide isomerase/thioredoxin